MVQDAENRLVKAIQKQTEKITYFCSAENISPNLGVHEIRKSFKRIRGLLRFYTEKQNEYHQKLIGEIKTMGKQLSPARESFVNLQIFDRLTRSSYLIPDKKIKGNREILSEKNRRFIDEYSSQGLCDNIVSFLEKTELLTGNLQASRLLLPQVEKQISASFYNAFNIFQKLETEDTSENRHELRKVLKGLYYQLDFIKYIHPRYLRMKSNQLSKITEHLGDDHDLVVFLEEIKFAEYDFTDEELTIFENQVEHQRELNMLKLIPRLRQFFNESPEMFSLKLEKIFKM